MDNNAVARTNTANTPQTLRELAMDILKPGTLVRAVNETDPAFNKLEKLVILPCAVVVETGAKVGVVLLSYDSAQKLYEMGQQLVRYF